MRIFLTGMPGCGKSTFGKKAAAELNIPFYDLDKEIVNHEGTNISEIFEIKGEAYFRQIETTLLRNLADEKDNFILATGGGAPCFFDNMNFMNQHGITFFIDASIEHLLSRLSEKGIEKRPLLKKIGAENLRNGLTEKLNYRKSFYNLANIVLPYKENLEKDIIEAIKARNENL